MKIEIRSTASLSAAEQAYLHDWGYKIFAGQSHGLVWAGGDWLALIWEGETLASQIEIVERVGKVGEMPVKLGGIGGVATSPAWRGRGLATLAMQKAMEFLRTGLYAGSGAEFGLLICDMSMVPFYGRLGWKLAGESLWIEQPGGVVEFQTPVMVWPCQQEKENNTGNSRREWPAGKIDLCGLPW